MGSGRTFVAGVIFVVAVVALVVGVVYLTETAHSLPSFFPGHSASAAAVGKHTKRGYAGIGAGVVLLLISIALLATRKRRRYY
ncbi:MAG: hypothetical protein ACYCSF_11235 [Acidimicrobiales bacterium]